MPRVCNWNGGSYYTGPITGWAQVTAKVISGHSYTLTLINNSPYYFQHFGVTSWFDTIVLSTIYYPSIVPTLYVPSVVPSISHLPTVSPNLEPSQSHLNRSSIINSDFEDGLSNWNSTGEVSVLMSGCYRGTSCVLAGASTPTNGTSSISQSFTVIGDQSLLSFYYKMTCPDTEQYDWTTAFLVDLTANTTWMMPSERTSRTKKNKGRI